MAKTIDMFPSKKGDKLQDVMGLDDFVTLMRAALDGDKQAKKVVLNFLDYYEQNKDLFHMLDSLRDREDGEDDGFYPPLGYDGSTPMTLPRRDVKEYHVRVKLNHTDLKIWREVKVPSNITLEALARLLLDVMGWMMEHMYEFRFKGDVYCSKEQMEDSFFAECKDFSRYTLSDLLTEKSVRMKLEYDYGDSWEHDVWVKGIREYDKGEKPSITFVAGHGECPPEDCGGVFGYAELLALTKKKKLSKEERERLEWYEMGGKYYDPDFCDEELYEEIADDYNAMLNNA